MQTIENIPVWGDPVDEGALRQIKNCAKTADFVALMADHHLGYAVPIGGVVAYENKISPSGVGYDIACGNKAVLLDMPASEARKNIKKIMDDIFSTISFGMGQKNNEKVDHSLFDSDTWSLPMVAPLKELARSQLGTVGSGNHYVDIFEDEKERVWIGVHFGSRGLGHKIATWFLRKGGATDGIDSDPLVIDADSAMGMDYLQCMHLAGDYAYAGRDWVCSKVAEILGAKILEEVHNHHNFAWYERHNGRWVWVVRKGATPAWPGQPGFVGGSMGENSVILQGVESAEAASSFYSTVHGAGRVMGRRAAKGKFVKDENGKKQRQPGLVRHDEMMKWLTDAGVTLRGGGLDEAPQCYKRLPEVLRHHAGSIKILHTLKPLGVAMAGEDEFDPYKD